MRKEHEKAITELNRRNSEQKTTELDNAKERCAREKEALEIKHQREMNGLREEMRKDITKSGLPKVVAAMEAFESISKLGPANKNSVIDTEASKLINLINQYVKKGDIADETEKIIMRANVLDEKVGELNVIEDDFEATVFKVLQDLFPTVEKRFKKFREDIKGLRNKSNALDDFIRKLNTKYGTTFGGRIITQDNFADEIVSLLDRNSNILKFSTDVRMAVKLNDPSVSDEKLFDHLRKMQYLWDQVSEHVNDAGTFDGAQGINTVFRRLKEARGAPVGTKMRAEQYAETVRRMQSTFENIVAVLRGYVDKNMNANEDRDVRDAIAKLSKFFDTAYNHAAFTDVSKPDLVGLEKSIKELDAVYLKIVGENVGSSVSGIMNTIEVLQKSQKRYDAINTKLTQAGIDNIEDFIANYSAFMANYNVIRQTAEEAIIQASAVAFEPRRIDNVLNSLNFISKMTGGEEGFAPAFRDVAKLSKHDKTALIMRMRKHIIDIEIQFRSLMAAVKKKENIKAA